MAINAHSERVGMEEAATAADHTSETGVAEEVLVSLPAKPHESATPAVETAIPLQNMLCLAAVVLVSKKENRSPMLWGAAPEIQRWIRMFTPVIAPLASVVTRKFQTRVFGSVWVYVVRPSEKLKADTKAPNCADARLGASGAVVVNEPDVLIAAVKFWQGGVPHTVKLVKPV